MTSVRALISISLFFASALPSRGFAKDFNAANPKQIREAHCTLKTAPNDSELREWIERNSAHSPIVSEVDIHGISLKGERLVHVQALKELLEPRGEDYAPLEGLQKRFPHVACDQVACAVSALFGEALGLRYLYLLERYGLNASPIVFQKAAKWAPSELDDVILGITDFPEGLVPSLGHQPLILSRESNEGEIANRTIKLFPEWRKESSEYRRYAVFHENAHRFGVDLGFETTPEWLNVSGGWSKPYTKFTNIGLYDGVPLTPEKISSLYGETNPSEDFAESMSQYRYAPEELIRTNPEKYEMLKTRFFDGIEYLGESGCAKENQTSYGLKTALAVELERMAKSPRAEDASNALAATHAILLQNIADGTRFSELEEAPPLQSAFQAGAREAMENAFIRKSLKPLPSVIPGAIRFWLKEAVPEFDASASRTLSRLTLEKARTLIGETLLAQLDHLNGIGLLKDGQDLDCPTFVNTGLEQRLKSSREFQKAFPSSNDRSLAALQDAKAFRTIARNLCPKFAVSPKQSSWSDRLKRLGIELGAVSSSALDERRALILRSVQAL